MSTPLLCMWVLIALFWLAAIGECLLMRYDFTPLGILAVGIAWAGSKVEGNS